MADPEYPPYAWYGCQTLRGASADVVPAVLPAIRLAAQQCLPLAAGSLRRHAQAPFGTAERRPSRR